MTALLASFWPYVLAAAGVVAAFVTRWWTKRQGAKAVAQAQADTAAQTRQTVAVESQAAASTATANAAAVASKSDASAAQAAAQGDDALNDALKAKGALRD